MTAPVPSSFCDPVAEPFDIQGAHVCDPTGNLTTSSWLGPGRDRNTEMDIDAVDDTHGNASEGFGSAVALLPYVLDWGDIQPKLRRRRFLPTILKAYPRREDRIYAHRGIADFVSPLDTCDPPITLHLLRAEPFVGYGWDVHTLSKWLDQVQRDGCTDPPRAALSEQDAIPLALAWLAQAAQLWRLYTSEHFPYDLLDLVGYWTLHEGNAALPVAGPNGSTL
jgi:hypothetical protein